MNKFGSIFLVALTGVLATLGLAPAAQAYPDGGQNISVSDQVVYSAKSFTVKATSDVTCEWAIEWNGDTRTKTSKNFTVRFKAPVVTEVTKIPLTGTCVYDTNDVSARASEPATFEKTIMITVLPAKVDVSAPGDGDDGDDLPATGGPNLWILIAGVASLVAGAVVVRTAKRRGAQA